VRAPSSPASAFVAPVPTPAPVSASQRVLAPPSATWEIAALGEFGPAGLQAPSRSRQTSGFWGRFGRFRRGLRLLAPRRTLPAYPPYPTLLCLDSILP